jgi:antitoxin component YwqK of YwqJK toxin-antitoxin module
MKISFLLIVTFFLACPEILSQSAQSLNATDNKGQKQGHWIKKYADGHIQYEGYFKDDHPVGLFKRYYQTDTLQSALEFNQEGTEAEAILFHPNGLIASTGKFVNQKKEGKWRFYSSSVRGLLVIEEEYKNNLKNGLSIKYYPEKVPAEKIIYVNDLKNGEWTQYFPSGNLCLKAMYSNGKLHGIFSTFYDSGKSEYIGQYNNDLRTGVWKIYNPDGTLKYDMIYIDGVISNPETYRKETEYLDLLEKNKGKIADPEKTGTIW